MTPWSGPVVNLGSDVYMPQIGYGVLEIEDSVVGAAVSAAIDAGYRAVDTASIYGNEAGVGHGLRKSGVSRDDIFVTTKLWNSDQGYEETLCAFDASLSKLGLDYVDLYLVHWPVPSRDLYLPSWRALRTIRESNRSRAIGVSNFQIHHLERLIEDSGVTPAVNQIELHPGLQQRELRRFHAEHGIVTEAWSPLAQGRILDDPVIVEIAVRHGATSAQVVLRWHLQHDTVIIPKSATTSRMKSNLDVFGFALSPEDMSKVDGLDREMRIGPHPDDFVGPVSNT